MSFHFPQYWPTLVMQGTLSSGGESQDFTRSSSCVTIFLRSYPPDISVRWYCHLMFLLTDWGEIYKKLRSILILHGRLVWTVGEFWWLDHSLLLPTSLLHCPCKTDPKQPIQWYSVKILPKWPFGKTDGCNQEDIREIQDSRQQRNTDEEDSSSPARMSADGWSAACGCDSPISNTHILFPYHPIGKVCQYSIPPWTTWHQV